MTEFYFIYMACVCMCVQVCKYLLPQTILLLILCTFESIFFPNVISGLKHLKFLFTFLILILGHVCCIIERLLNLESDYWSLKTDTASN